MVSGPLPPWRAPLITMRVIEISAFGPPEVLRPNERAIPPAGASDLPGLKVAGVIVAGDAHALMESNQHVGKLVLSW